MKEREIGLDALRGLAVFFMLVFHLAVDLEDFFGFRIGYRQGAWQLLRCAIAAAFLLVSGYAAGAGLNRHIVKNGCKLLAAALVVSVSTYFFDEHTYVRFGILHLLACATLLTLFFQRLSSVQLFFLAIIFLVLGNYLENISVTTELLLPLGLTPEKFLTLDYYPLLPWLAVFLGGIILGRNKKLPASEKSCICLRVLAFVGRHALFIYLVHQPLFLLSLTLLLG